MLFFRTASVELPPPAHTRTRANRELNWYLSNTGSEFLVEWKEKWKDANRQLKESAALKLSSAEMLAVADNDHNRYIADCNATIIAATREGVAAGLASTLHGFCAKLNERVQMGLAAHPQIKGDNQTVFEYRHGHSRRHGGDDLDSLINRQVDLRVRSSLDRETLLVFRDARNTLHRVAEQLGENPRITNRQLNRINYHTREVINDLRQIDSLRADAAKLPPLEPPKKYSPVMEYIFKAFRMTAPFAEGTFALQYLEPDKPERTPLRPPLVSRKKINIAELIDSQCGGLFVCGAIAQACEHQEQLRKERQK